RPGRSRVKWASLAGENIRRSLFSNGVAVTANYGPGIIPYRVTARCERVGIMSSRLPVSARPRAGSLAPGRGLLHSAPWQGADHWPAPRAPPAESQPNATDPPAPPWPEWYRAWFGRCWQSGGTTAAPSPDPPPG